MKTIFLPIFAFIACMATTSVYAATCKTEVEQALVRHLRANHDDSDVASTTLVSTKGSVRHYLVEVYSQYADYGASYDFPPEYYLVTAVGTQYACIVKNIKEKQ